MASSRRDYPYSSHTSLLSHGNVISRQRSPRVLDRASGRARECHSSVYQYCRFCWRCLCVKESKTPPYPGLGSSQRTLRPKGDSHNRKISSRDQAILVETVSPRLKNGGRFPWQRAHGDSSQLSFFILVHLRRKARVRKDV